MRIALIHPSRGRPSLAGAAASEWLGHATGAHPIEYLLSVDADDPELPAYRKLAEARGLALLVGENRSVVDAVNAAARACRGDLLVVVSDDFGCPEGWDQALCALAPESLDCVIQVADGIEDRIVTLPVLGRRLYERLGHVYHPDYFSMYADDELTEVARRQGRLVDARHLLFPHRHFAISGVEPDATYRRQNSPEAWRRGERVFARRRACGFADRPGPGAWPRLLWTEVRFGLRRMTARLRDGAS